MTITLKHSSLLIFAISTATATIAIPWQSFLETHRNTMGETTHKHLHRQLTSYSENNAPTIAAPIIKEIPIIESGEPLADCTNAKNNRLVLLPNPEKPFTSADCNAGFACSGQMRKTVLDNLETMINYLDEHAEEFGYQPGQMTIKIFEGLRNFKTQKMIFDLKLEETKKAHPEWSDEQAFTETAKWVSPVINNVPVHATGGAVDIRIWDSYNGQYLDVGKFGVIGGANPTAPTFSEEITDIQKLNRLYILATAHKAGLINYLYEHWHFSSNDRYAAYWTTTDRDARRAHYDMIRDDN